MNENEVTAEVVDEHTPEIKWPERVLIIRDRGVFKAHPCGQTRDIDKMAKWSKSAGTPYRIIRIVPPTQPKKQRAEIDWVAVNRLVDDRHFPIDSVIRIINECAKIVEVPNDACADSENDGR